GGGCVIALGRNKKVLNDLVQRFGNRVRTVSLSGDETMDRERILQTALGPIDYVLDILPPTVCTTVVHTAIMTVRPGGRIVLMGEEECWEVMHYNCPIRGS